MKRVFFLILMLLFMASSAYSQGVVKGIIVDKSSREILVGVSVYNPTSGVGTGSALDGSFSIPLTGKQELKFSYVGYKTKTLNAESGQDLGFVELETEAIGLNDVTVTSSVAIRRKTPVALSVITPLEIEERIGTQEFPELLKSTPGVYATKQGGGYGDSRINLRGFESANIAVMINGVPMNDMEWGGVYWSNWAGISDVTRSTQIQRGLGASKVAAPSIGGSINIVTRSTDARRGGAFSYTVGNDGYNKIGFNISTGLNDKGWAMTLLGAKTWGNGYILGTEFEAYTWFANISKIINADHQLSLTAFGNMQWHNQRYNGDMLLIPEWQKLKDGYRFNPTYGFGTDGRRVIPNRNRYHKPQISLNHAWTINEKSSLSTAAYLSLGDGGGRSWRGTSYNNLYGTNTSTGLMNTQYRNPLTGYVDYGILQRENSENPNGSQAVLTESRNNHVWVGLLSTYTTRLASYIDFYGGLDLRYYEGLHDAYIVDLMGGKFFVDPSRKNVFDPLKKNNPDFVNQKLVEGDIVYRNNTGYVMQQGVFAQGEYNKGPLSVFLSASASNSLYWKVDRFYYSGDAQRSEAKSFIGYNLKGGANYNIDEHHNVFFNTGYLSRAPFMSGGYFTTIHTSNAVNKNAVNEKSFSAEVGYGFRSRYLAANLNLYYTKWMDKTMTRAYGDDKNAFINLRGVDARHQGVELDFSYRPLKRLEISGMLSLGDWIWDSKAVGYIYDANGQPTTGSKIVEDQSDLHKVEIDLTGVKVGNSAQTTAKLGVSYRLFDEALNLGVDYFFYGRNYAGYNISVPNAGGSYTYKTPFRIPDAGEMNLFASYRFKLGGLDASLIGNVNNLLNQHYIADARYLTPQVENTGDWKNVSVIYGFLRTYSVSLKVKF